MKDIAEQRRLMEAEMADLEAKVGHPWIESRTEKRELFKKAIIRLGACGHNLICSVVLIATSPLSLSLALSLSLSIHLTL